VVVNCLCEWPSGDYFRAASTTNSTPIDTAEEQSAFSLLYNPTVFEVESGLLLGGISLQMDEIVTCSDSTIIGTHLAAVLGPNNVVVTYDDANTPLDTFAVVLDLNTYPDELQIVYTSERIHFYALFTADKFVGSFALGTLIGTLSTSFRSSPTLGHLHSSDRALH